MGTPHRGIVLLWLASGIAAAALLNWHFRFNAAGDTVNYFEIASKYASGRYAEAVVQYWSPLYSWLLVPIMGLPRTAHLPAAHALQVALFVFSLWATWRLVAMIGRTGRELTNAELALVLGVSLTAALTVIPSRYLTPDLLAFALVLWFIARVGKEAAGTPGRPWRQIATGALWAAGYLARAYVLAFGGAVLLLASFLVHRNATLQQRLRWLGAYVIGFLLIAGPWIGTLSYRAGRLTWGEAGTNNILAVLDREPIEPAPWPRAIAAGRITSFERPFALTLPESYDIVPGGTFRYRNVWRTYPRIVVGNVEALFFGFFPPDLPLFWPLGILAVLAGVVFIPAARASPGPARLAEWLLICGALGFAMFIAVHVESRYVAPFLVLVAAAIVHRAAQSPSDRRGTIAATLALVGALFWLFPFFVWLDGLRSSRAVNGEGQRAEAHWLAEHGERYAAVGATYDLGMPAWLSETAVIASVDLRNASPAHCEQVASELRSLNVAGVLSRGTVECGPWQPVPGTGWSFWNLQSAPRSVP
jgi:hypothetical protein